MWPCEHPVTDHQNLQKQLAGCSKQTPQGLGLLGVRLFPTVPEKQMVVMEWASVEVHSWWFPTLVRGRFPRHRFGGQIIWGRISRMSCSLCFAMLPRIPQTPQLWPYVPEPRVGSRRAGNMGSHMSPAPRASCQAFLVIGNSLQALKEVWKLVASSPDLLKR